MVPTPSDRSSLLHHGRLRRSSPATRFAASAALEAIGEDLAEVRNSQLRLGVILCVMAGCISYSRRFYEETLQDPRTASPVVFPETVFNAPASHLAALLGGITNSYTVVGDPGMFLIGLAMGADWLLTNQVDACVVVGTEEMDWLTADAYRRFERHTIVSEGAGAVYLRPLSGATDGIELTAVTDAHSFVRARPHAAAVRAMRTELPESHADHLLCDSLRGASGLDRLESAAWADWNGARLSPKLVLGEGLAAGSAWQCAAAIDSLRQHRFSAASVSIVGPNQQAVGAHFVRRTGSSQRG